MFIYNVILTIDRQIHQDWLRWQTEVHMPNVMRTGMFTGNRICRMLSEEESTVGYSVEYYFRTMGDYEKYKNEFASRLQKEPLEKFGDKIVASRMLLEVI
ncbi:MAG: DUF4286 family protein [Ignavibacteriae bacterium]|nr:DUF4286 family protein [Ignavibacteriota bacterium]